MLRYVRTLSAWTILSVNAKDIPWHYSATLFPDKPLKAQIFTPSVISLYCFHILFSAVVVHCLFQLNLIKTIHKTCKSAELGRPAAAIVRPTTSDGTGVMPVDSKAKFVWICVVLVVICKCWLSFVDMKWLRTCPLQWLYLFWSLLPQLCICTYILACCFFSTCSSYSVHKSRTFTWDRGTNGHCYFIQVIIEVRPESSSKSRKSLFSMAVTFSLRCYNLF